MKKRRTVLRTLKYIVTLQWPLLPSVCMYYPTCSMYTLEAIRKFGVLRGIGMGAKRIWRCSPWGEGGFDPVPDNPKGDMKWLF